MNESVLLDTNILSAMVNSRLLRNPFNLFLSKKQENRKSFNRILELFGKINRREINTFILSPVYAEFVFQIQRTLTFTTLPKTQNNVMNIVWDILDNIEIVNIISDDVAHLSAFIRWENTDKNDKRFSLVDSLCISYALINEIPFYTTDHQISFLKLTYHGKNLKIMDIPFTNYYDFPYKFIEKEQEKDGLTEELITIKIIDD